MFILGDIFFKVELPFKIRQLIVDNEYGIGELWTKLNLGSISTAVW